MKKILFFLVAAIAAVAYSSASQPEEQTPQWLEEGRVAFAEGDTLKLVGVLEKWLPKVEKFGPDYEKILFCLGEFYSDLNDTENFYRIFQLQDEHNQNELKKECKTVEQRLDRASYFAYSGRFDEANTNYIAAFEMPMTQAQRYKAADAYAKFLHLNNDFAGSAEYFLMAAKALEDSLGPVKESVTAKDLAATSLFLSEAYDRAIPLFNKVYEEMGPLNFPDSIRNEKIRMAAICHQAKGDHEKAVEVITKYIDNTGETTKARAGGLASRAFSRRFSGDLDGALADYEKAIAIYEKLGLDKEVSSTKSSLDRALIVGGRQKRYSDEETAFTIDKDETHRIIEEEKQTIARTGNLMGNMFTASSLGMIAGNYAMIEEYPEALDYYSQFMPLLRTALADDFLYRNARERELSWDHIRSNLDELNKLFLDIPDEQPAERQKLAALLYDAQLLSKGVLLTSTIEFEKVLRRLGDPSLEASYDSIKASRLLLDKMRAAGNDPNAILALTRQTDRKQIELQHKSAELSRYTDFMKFTHSDVAKALPADAAAIEFIMIDDPLFFDKKPLIAVIVTADNPNGVALPFYTEGEFVALAKLADLYQNPVYASALLSPLMPYLDGKKTVYFAPDGPLHSIAIENLTGLPFEMVRVSSTKEVCRESAAIPIREAALFGNIDYILANPSAKRSSDDGLASFGELANTAREIKEISSLLKKGKVHVKAYEQLNATKAVFLTDPKKPVNLLHVATHGKYFKPDDPNINDAGNDAMKRSVLAFAGANIEGDSAIANAAEIAAMDLRDCELVVLSACESGLGQLGSDGVFGLQRGFKNAGAKSLLVSLSPVSDDATADMMIAFYARLFDRKNQLPPRAALREAQREIRAKYPDDSTWASFIIIDALN